MNTPNPLVPQGSLPASSKGKSTIRIAVLTIVAIHAVFFAGLLMQGCKRDEAAKTSSTKIPDLAIPPGDMAKIETNSYAGLQDAAAGAGTNAVAGGGTVATTPLPTALTSPSSLPLSAPAGATPPELPVGNVPVETKEYKIAKGDKLGNIAKAHHVSVKEILSANPGLDAKKMKVDQKIQIPVVAQPAGGITGGAAAGKAGVGKPDAGGLGLAEPATESHAATTGGIHVVKQGETLTKIAKQHNTTVKALRAANNLKTDRLVEKQKLKIPAPSKAASAVAPAAKTSHATNAAVGTSVQ
jgi:LysM repeat protein